MHSASTRRFTALPLAAALAIAVSVGVGISFFAIDYTQTSSSQNLSTTEEADIPAIIIRETGGPWVRSGDDIHKMIIRETGGPWVRPGDAPSTEMPIFGPGDGLVDPAAGLGGPAVGGTIGDRADAISGRGETSSVAYVAGPHQVAGGNEGSETSSDAYVAGPHQVAGGNEGALDDASSMDTDHIVNPRRGRTTK